MFVALKITVGISKFRLYFFNFQIILPALSPYTGYSIGVQNDYVMVHLQ